MRFVNKRINSKRRTNRPKKRFYLRILNRKLKVIKRSNRIMIRSDRSNSRNKRLAKDRVSFRSTKFLYL